MVKCVETEDVFFESLDNISNEHDFSVNGVLGYDFWRNEPKSIKERRHVFLHEMGFIDSCSSFESNDHDDDDHHDVYGDVHHDDGLEKMVERSHNVWSSFSSSSTDSQEETMVFYGREYNGDVNFHDNHHHVRQNMGFYDDDEPSTSNSNKSINKKIRQWWKEMMLKKYKYKQKNTKKFEMSKIKTHVNKKKFKELSALFEIQEIQAHKGIIWTMKFSPDGKYLATGGEDGVVRVWHVKSIDSSLQKFLEESTASSRMDQDNKVPIFIPDKLFRIEGFPVHEFHGHSADVLDIAWSKSNFLLSSSMDKTVRLWKMGSNESVTTFQHTDYVTCVQFNPEDDRYFISGSIDGKVRIWGLSNHRVIDWFDVKEAVTAACYQPDGQAFVVGSLNGNCLFYETKGKLFELNACIRFRSRKTSSTNRITGIQFTPEDSSKVIVMSEDSKLRIIDKMEVVHKFRGLSKSGCQMSASFTSNGRHIVSIGQDSRIYIWNHENPIEPSSRQTSSNRSCEHFYCEGVSVALPWCDSETASNNELESACIAQDTTKQSLSKMFSSKRTATWPEDTLPMFTTPDDQCQGRTNVAHCSTWGLVMVTASFDGKIRTYHNYGFPIRV
ncbi:uncharacterized WD repeat-containing protein C3H5.08c-like [Amaranthus tricolor]|uniref:uncharacterized WD repeat-containing protein C3H5.08c-like n=1 Tax=Amaranthus tricolor TaxID=29722 RepID=UPI00258EE462|nr:uncharacterized WD repeat-containing protein C3H5.08c-like [Amaranthus tricolor]